MKGWKGIGPVGKEDRREGRKEGKEREGTGWEGVKWERGGGGGATEGVQIGWERKGNNGLSRGTTDRKGRERVGMDWQGLNGEGEGKARQVKGGAGKRVRRERKGMRREGERVCGTASERGEKRWREGGGGGWGLDRR